MRDFSGMLFTLKKREQWIDKDDSEYYKFMILGFYDGLDIHTVDKWYELRPKGLLERELQVDLNTPFIDQYTIRAMGPSNRDDLDKQGFAYDFWENLGRESTKSCRQYRKELRNKYPFICMSVINLTEKFVKQKSNLQAMQDSLTTILKDAALKSGYTFEELHCAVYPSLGYSDFIVLFLTDNLIKASNIISCVRASIFHLDQAEVPVVSNCYSVCGLDRDYFAHTNRPALDENVQITIRINLREGLSAGDFLMRLRDKIGRNGSPETDTVIQSLNKNYFFSFGNSDCLILPNQSLDQYLLWHGPGGILNPGNGFFEENIASVRTSVRIGGLECGAGAVSKALTESNLDSYKNAFKEFIEKYDRFLNMGNMHIRSSRAIRQTMKNFLNIAPASHGFDVRNIVGRAFLYQIADVEYYIGLKEKAVTDGMTEDEKAEIEQYNAQVKKEKLCAVVSLEDFKNNVGSFLSDLIRSDRPFIEGNVLTHSSIGSATKLLFAYSAMLNNFLHQFGREDDFSFIVTSGGCDKTEAIDGFNFAHGSTRIKKPIVVTIPEMSLYDIQGTLFRLLHEYMHFIGDRRRAFRYSCLVNAVAKSIAWKICDIKFGELERDWISMVDRYLPTRLEKLAKRELTAVIQKEKESSRMRIEEAIRKQSLFVEFEEQACEAEFYSDRLKEGILSLDSMIDIFSVITPEFEKVSEGSLQKQIYRILHRAEKEIIWQIKEWLGQKQKEYPDVKNLLLPDTSFAFLEDQYKIYDVNKKEYDRELRGFIDQYFNSLVGNFSMSTGAEEAFFAGYSYTDLRDGILFAMVESFSDCCAVRAVDLAVEDFLLAFIYEEWEMEEVFPNTLGNVLRLGADLQVLYGITQTLDERVKNAVYERVKQKEQQGYTYRNVDDMLKYVNDILRKYRNRSIEGARSEVEAYLRECINNSDEWYSEELGALYKVSSMNTTKNTYEAVDKIICLWKNIGGTV